MTAGAGASEPVDGRLERRMAWRLANEEALAPVEPLPGYRQYVGEPPGLDYTDRCRRVSAASRNYTGEIAAAIDACDDRHPAFEYRRQKLRVRRGLRQLGCMPKAARFCGSPRGAGEVVSVTRGEQTGAVGYRGRQHCGLICCTMCRDERLARYRRQIASILAAARDRGASAEMLTFAIPHRAHMPFRAVHQTLQAAWRRLFASGAWKDAAGAFGYVGQVRVVEITCSIFAGWHPHIHALLIFSRPLQEGERRALQVLLVAHAIPLVIDEAVRHNLGEDYPVPDVDHLVHLAACRSDGEYIAKSGLVAELVAPGGKAGRTVAGVRHITIDGIEEQLASMRLRYGAEGPVDRERDRKRFERCKAWHREYVEATHGLHLFHMTPGLIEKVNALPLAHDLPRQLAHDAVRVKDEVPEATVTVYSCSSARFSEFLRAGVLAELELERLVREGATGEEVGRFVDDVIRRKWHPKIDPLDGRDEDSPLFQKGRVHSGECRSTPTSQPVRHEPVTAHRRTLP